MILRLIGLIDMLGVRILRKTLAGNLDSMVLRLKITRFLFGPLILVTYSLVFELWKNCKLVLEV
jgi:hypothetical protein